MCISLNKMLPHMEYFPSLVTRIGEVVLEGGGGELSERLICKLENMILSVLLPLLSVFFIRPEEKCILVLLLASGSLFPICSSFALLFSVFFF